MRAAELIQFVVVLCRLKVTIWLVSLAGVVLAVVAVTTVVSFIVMVAANLVVSRWMLNSPLSMLELCRSAMKWKRASILGWIRMNCVKVHSPGDVDHV